MKRKRAILICLLVIMAGLNSERSSSATANADGATSAASSTAATNNTDGTQKARESSEERAMRLEGEKRFRTNCGRCHQPPHKFPPRVMAAAIRHMRVRATITDEDMRLILRYMTQ